MLLYLVRHGQSTGNIVTEDVPDGPLTELGTIQAESAAEGLRGKKIDMIIASPLLRALQTALPIAKDHGLKIHAWRDVCECRTLPAHVSVPPAELMGDYPIATMDEDMEPEGWLVRGDETDESCRERADRVYQRLLTEVPKDAAVVVVGHAGFNTRLLSRILGTEGVRFRQANACINVIEITDDDIIVRAVNETSHIPAEATKKAV